MTTLSDIAEAVYKGTLASLEERLGLNRGWAIRVAIVWVQMSYILEE